MTTSNFEQPHSAVIWPQLWWWATVSGLLAFGAVGNVVVLITVVYNRRLMELRTVSNALMVAVATVDLVDVLRIFPLFFQVAYEQEMFRHLYCSLGTFHELSVALLLLAITLNVCIQTGRGSKNYTANTALPRVHKLIIPTVLILSLVVAIPFFVLDYNTLGHVCTDPIVSIDKVLDVQAQDFYTHLYTTALTLVTYLIPFVLMPLLITVSLVRSCVRRRCCSELHKQSMGELAMTLLVDLLFLISILIVVIPKMEQAFQLGTGLKVGPVPLVIELSNNAVRPIIYMLMNPALRLGLRLMCCRKSGSHSLVNDHNDDLQQPLSPVTSV